MHFVIKPKERKVELKNNKREIVKVAVLLPAYPIVFLYSEDGAKNSLKYHSFSLSGKGDTIYFDGLEYVEDTVVDITEDNKVDSFVFLEEFELTKFDK